MSAILFMASAASDGNTKKICEYVEDTFDLPLLDFNDYRIDYYSYTEDAHRDDFISLVERILEYNTIVFATPVYWYAMSAQMKTFLDRLTDLLKQRKDLGRQLRQKNMKVICCSSDETLYPEFWWPFQRSAQYLGMNYLGHVHTWIAGNSIPKSVKFGLNQLFEQG